ncbi:DUF6543 domain-containing protein [Luteibacter aegosomatissinici]|uniref:DUF6543 domain-containing protein n=1 Tax=Luteibacter aegosomatissinici TaxID=2911539 RepID=UPI001FFB09FB|nr:DUF6543 domain-containing protein [Luteibacter aegosomatissinici]UPG94851.1 hypothetical protein L2Y97_01735 [Luteibacter aegosomatissinici]
MSERRLVGAARWQTAMMERSPLLPDALTPDGKAAFLASLEAWWNASATSTDTTPARTALATHLAQVMRDDATLRGLQGTLSAADAARVVAWLDAGGHIAPPGTDARELMIGQEPYAGSIILARADGALLFLPERGWEAFASLDQLHHEVEERTRHELMARDTLPGTRNDIVDRIVKDDRFVDSRPTSFGGIPVIAQRLVALQAAQVGEAWDGLNAGDDPVTVADAVRVALDLHGKIDIENMQRDREWRVAANRQVTRLAAVPAGVRTAWWEAEDALRNAQVHAEQLAAQAAAAPVFAAASSLSLADAVRSYREALMGMLDVPAGSPLREASIALRSAQFRLAVADARLGYYPPSEPRRFLPDHGERGYTWMRSVFESPAANGRGRVDGHEIVVRQLTYRGAVIGDLLAIGAREPRSASRVILYTPDAPDGIDVREFVDGEEAAREFLYNPRFEAWLLARLPASHARSDANGQLHFDVPAHVATTAWVLGTTAAGTRTRTAEAFGQREVSSDIFEASHAAELSRISVDLYELEASLRETQRAPALHIVQAAIDTSAAPDRAARDLIAGLGQGLRALWRLEDALRAGDYAQAAIDGSEAYVGLLGALPVAQVAARPGLFLQASMAGRGASRGALKPALHPLDKRYAATGVDLAGLRPDARGIHTLAGRRYIVSAGQAFEVRFDTGNTTWRLARPGALDSTYAGPPVRWTASGWQLRPDVGLRGGRTGTPPPDSPALRVSAAGYFELTAHQRDTFLRTLRRRLGNSAADDMHTDVLLADAHGIAVGRRRWNAWSEALHTGRGAPAVAPAATPRAVVASPPWRELPASEWPDTVWYQAPEFAGSLERPSLYLPVVRVRGAGVSGVVVSPLDPALQQARGMSLPSRWVQIDLRRLRWRGQGGTPALRVFANDSGANPHLVLRSAADAPAMYFVLRQGDFSVARAPVP